MQKNALSTVFVQVLSLFYPYCLETCAGNNGARASRSIVRLFRISNVWIHKNNRFYEKVCAAITTVCRHTNGSRLGQNCEGRWKTSPLSDFPSLSRKPFCFCFCFVVCYTINIERSLLRFPGISNTLRWRCIFLKQ